MNKLFLILLLPFSLVAQNSAPIDYTTKSIKLQDGFQNFLQLGSGTVSEINQSGWDIAIYNDAHEIGGKINEDKGVRVWRVYKDTSNFSTVTIADTLFPIENSDSFMYLGAMDTIYKGNFLIGFRIGLGKFFSSYNAVGDRMYIIKKSDGSFEKFFLRIYNYPDSTFNFRFSNLDNTNDRIVQVNKIKKPFTKHYQYININTGAVSNSFEPSSFNSWDLVFRKYQKNISKEIFPIGVMSNNVYNLIRFSNVDSLPPSYLKYGLVSTEIYQANGNPLTTIYNNSLNTFEPITRLNNQIGEKWYNSSLTKPSKDISYFLRDRLGKIWHLIFTDYESSTNAVSMAYKQVGTTNSIYNNIKSEIYDLKIKNGVLMVTNHNLNLNSELIIYDMNGKQYLKNEFNKDIQVDISTLLNQFVIIQLSNQSNVQTFKFFIN